MPFSRADTLAAARQSLHKAAAHDRAGWLDLFAATALVEDPVGSRPHRGRDQLDRFYETFIAPRQITAHPRRDIVAGTTVVRDATLEVVMSPSVTMMIPAYLRYDLDPVDLRIIRLQAYWELPAMVGQFLRAGPGAVPAGARLSSALLRNQGARGTVGFLTGFRGVGGRGKRSFARFLADAHAGDEIAVRRRLPGPAPTRDGARGPIPRAALSNLLAAGASDKLVVAGRHAVASVERDGRHGVLIASLAAPRYTVTGLQYFADDEAGG
ncbi:nuclear transport factor 2 family protein [Mycobacterium sp. NPDC050041]|uniref:nuclear transport factor 2 family protein n=1 Tax=Mycobacterium sp. NPDC050041 TaxID=3364293 RepID=UPI003C2D0E5B